MMNTILNLYFKLPHDRSLGIVTKIINRLAARLIKRLLDRTVPNYFIKTQEKYPIGINQLPRDEVVIVSLTSFPGRIDDVWIVIECLFRQTYKADKILLWLSSSQFEGIELPKKLLEQQDRGLEICFVSDDIRSHKKYYYALKKFSDNIIITVDDDVYYQNEVLEKLMIYHTKFPNQVIGNRGHEILFDSSNNILPYRNWLHNVKKNISSFLFVPTGVGGVLYPPKSLTKELLNVEKIKELCFHADDLWLKVGSLVTNSKVYITKYYRQEFITVGKTQKNKLVTFNSLNGGNDSQFIAVLDHFKMGNLEKYKKSN
jgi:hypothetical protein